MSRSRDEQDELVEELRDRIHSLERRLDEQEESRKRADAIIAQLAQSNTALNERLRELEAGAATPAPTESHEAGAEEPAEGAAAGLQVKQAGTGAPASSAKTSRRTIAEGVTVGLTVLTVSTVAKLASPVIFSTVAFVVAGAAVVNGQFLVALVSGSAGVLSGLLSYYIGRRQVNRDWMQALEDVQQSVDQMIEDLVEDLEESGRLKDLEELSREEPEPPEGRER